MRREASLTGGLLCVVALTACVTELATPDGLHRKREVRTYPAAEARVPALAEAVEAELPPEPPGLIAPSALAEEPASRLSPYHRFSHRTIRAVDGRLTRMYWIRAGNGPLMEGLIKAHTRATGAPDSDTIVTLIPSAQKDPRPKVPPTGALAAMYPGVENVSDLLTVTAREDVLLEVDQFLTAVLTETPQIEIEGRVVEINFDDSIEVGANLFAKEKSPREQLNPDGTVTQLPSKNDIDTAFTFLESPLDPNAFLAGSQVGTLALAFFQNDVKFQLFLRAIQNSANSDVLSAPKMAVINGSRAVIETGRRIPVQTPSIGTNGQITNITTKFEDTGVKLIVTPFLLMDDMIQIDVMAEVSFVSGFVESGASGILNPIISSRIASTVVNVRDGTTFAIGGLITTDEIELVTKIPILGDIPLLGYLFKTRSVTERHSQVIFFITPRLVEPGAPLFDPGA